MSRPSAFAAAALLVLTACGGDDAGGGPEAPRRTDRVSLPKSYRFDPEHISVATGTTVTWTNDDDFPHDVTLLDGTKEKVSLPVGKSGTITFAQAGTFRYECSIHPQQMQGTVVVT